MTYKYHCFVRALVFVLYIVILNHSLATISKSFVGLKSGHKRTNIVTYHAVTTMGDLAVWPGVIPSDVRRSDLVNKHIKRGIVIFIHSIQLKIKFIEFDWLQFKFYSLQIKFNANQDSCFQRCAYNLKYIRSLESDMQWEVYNNTETRSPQFR